MDTLKAFLMLTQYELTGYHIGTGDVAQVFTVWARDTEEAFRNARRYVELAPESDRAELRHYVLVRAVRKPGVQSRTHHA